MDLFLLGKTNGDFLKMYWENTLYSRISLLGKKGGEGGGGGGIIYYSIRVEAL
jgi:hypothetical protein